VNRLADGIAHASLVTACALTAAIFLLINIEVVCRYVFGTSTLVADEFAAYGFAVMVYLGMVYAVRHDMLIRIDVPGRWRGFIARPALKIFGAFATLVLNVAMLYALAVTFLGSVRFQSRSIQVSKTLIAWPQGLALAALALLVVISVVGVLRVARRTDPR